MVPPMAAQDLTQPRLETRINLASKRLLLLLGERGSVGMTGLGAAPGVPENLAHIAAGWLARSRVADLDEDSTGQLHLRMRKPFE